MTAFEFRDVMQGAIELNVGGEFEPHPSAYETALSRVQYDLFKALFNNVFLEAKEI